MTRADTLDLAITALGAAGDGFARLPDGASCFVPRSLPGETLAVDPETAVGAPGVTEMLELAIGEPAAVPA